MNHADPVSTVRLKALQQQIDWLAGFKPGDGHVISCYLDLSQGRSRLVRFVRSRVASCAKTFPAGQAAALKAGCDTVVDRILSRAPDNARGLAVFVSTGPEGSLLSALPFAVPFHNSLSISSSPDLFPLLQLREMYGRFMIVLAREDGLQVAEVNLGEVSVRAWVAIRESAVLGDARTGTAMPRGHLDMHSQIRLVERILNRGRSGPLFLAGDVEVMQTIRDMLTPTLIAHLVGAVPVPADEPLHATAARCLRSLIEFEVDQAFELTARVLQEVSHNGAAVAGPAPSLAALRNGSAERLLLASDYRPEPGWVCARDQGPGTYPAQVEPTAYNGSGSSGPVDLRVELVRLAGQYHVPVEFIGDDALQEYDGVACVLRDHPEQQAQRLPARYGRLDLVA